MSRRSDDKNRVGPPRVVGFVCEGSTDIVVLRRTVEAVLGDIDPRELQPEVDELDRQRPGTPSGWSEVRAWCQRVESFADYFEPDVGDPLDLLVIALDLDIAIRAGLQKVPENLETYDAKALCDIVKSWLPPDLPSAVIVAIPVMAIEAWVLAALFQRLPDPELETAPAQILVNKKKIAMGRTGPWKRAAEYRPFAEAVVRKLKRVRKKCAAADRFVKKLEHFARFQA